MSDYSIPIGAKLQLALDVPIGHTPDFNMVSTFIKPLDSSYFLISIPMHSGKPLELNINRKILIRYRQGDRNLIITAYPEAVVNEGIRRTWKIRKMTEAREFIKRKNERMTVPLRISYSLPSRMDDDTGDLTTRESLTLDISDGGLAMYISERYDIGEVIQIRLPKFASDVEASTLPDLTAVICWYRESPKGSPYDFVTGVQFRLGNDALRDRVSGYLSLVKNIYKL